jgi:hypothetical protein
MGAGSASRPISRMPELPPLGPTRHPSAWCSGDQRRPGMTYGGYPQ